MYIHICIYIWSITETLTPVILSTLNFAFVKCKYILKYSAICYDAFANIFQYSWDRIVY